MLRAMAVRKAATFDAFTRTTTRTASTTSAASNSQGSTFFWKIDYYDPNLEFGSEDPADPTKTTRILTLMLADEY